MSGYDKVPEGLFSPRVRLKDDTQEVMSRFLFGVQKAIGDELEKRGVKPGDFAALHCDCPDGSDVRIVFTIRLRKADVTDIDFEGTS